MLFTIVKNISNKYIESFINLFVLRKIQFNNTIPNIKKPLQLHKDERPVSFDNYTRTRILRCQPESKNFDKSPSPFIRDP